MKLTKLQLKQIVAEELAKEGVLDDLFGSRKKKEFGYKWFDKSFDEMTPAELEKYKEMGKERGRERRETEKAAAEAEGAAKKKAREREEEERIEKHKRKVAAMDPKQRDIYLGFSKPEETDRVPGYFKKRQTLQREAGDKITKSDLEKIIREELEELMQEGGVVGHYVPPGEMVHEPRARDPKYACNPGYAYDSDLHLCIREDITAQSLRQDPNLGTQLNRAVTKLRGK